MNFDEAVKYLYSLGNEVSAMKLGLENIRILLAALGSPEKKYEKIQIAGTNGKGSVCAFLEAICLSAEIRVGLTTSPHLISVTERVKINGAEISEKSFAKYSTIVRKTAEQLIENGKLETAPTYFEQVTAAAFSAFAEAEIELAILETGLGGRFDATTAANAEIVALTPIDLDHQNILGDTIPEIAAEKAAIIRADAKVVCAEQSNEAARIIFARCEEFGIKPRLTNFSARIAGISDAKFVVNFQTEKAEYKNVKLNLRGKHQIENAKIAILLAETLAENGFRMTNENIVEGLETAVHHGRLEFQAGFLFDGAHNVSGAKAFRQFLDEFIKQPLTLIFGAMRDKDLAEITGILFPAADRLILTVPENERSLPLADLQKFVPKNYRKENVHLTENVAEALQIARKISPKENLIGVTGSLYLVGEARKILNNQPETR